MCLCVCVCVCVCACVCVCVCVCVWRVRVLKCYECALFAFVSALGSHEMGHHKLPIIIIIKHFFRLSIFCKRSSWQRKHR